ncbi:MAG TPA: 23S rRNA (pseudouridine(1915)-N(3))-methyltransferase RlmH, partial [Candidatus Methylomirabilis sp.]|nr:23S rRNA (pseudouridine(1915)-N(3))-methyltransferase RlmH [Candidatus Methylomirabilis sp.]
MLEIIILAVGKIKNKFFSEAIEEYARRLKPYAAVKIMELVAESFADASREQAKQKEGERLARALQKYDRADIFLMHERGKEMDSLEFSRQLENHSGKIIFVIAGALGFSEEILKEYRQLSLSRLTFPHEMARLILLEQIYRAVT